MDKIPLNISSAYIQTIQADWLRTRHLQLDVLRLDAIHPVIGGNKLFKLKHYIADAIAKKQTTIATFGGAWSNHIAATALACELAGLKCVGIIRGEKNAPLSNTLQLAMQHGMALHFTSRNAYRNKEEIKTGFAPNNWSWLNEGGYGMLGAKGAAEILSVVNTVPYSHIFAAAGTGTMLAGLVNAAAYPHQKIIGISAMKGNASLEKQVLHLIDETKQTAPFTILHDYHFGGYAKHPQELIQFMNEAYNKHSLPLDIVYTGKTFFAITNLVQQGHFDRGSRLLMVHSGGLQGNTSLPENVLAF